MRNRSMLAIWILAGVAVRSATCAGAEAAPKLPDPGKGEEVEKGILLHKVTVESGGGSTGVWIYLPGPVPQGAKLPCVVIPPAGSRMFHGMDLAKGDMDEHLPYVRAGFAVAAFTIAGPLAGDDPKDEEIQAAARAFVRADAGVKDGKRALDYVEKKVPSVDKNLLFCAGHSSAATLSLLLAGSDRRIKGCIAFAPVADVEKFMKTRSAQMTEELSKAIPGYGDFLKRASPSNLAAKIACPVFLFQASDDTIVPEKETAAFAKALSAKNPKVTYRKAAKGGHYKSMIDEGIPAAIEWLKGLAPGKSPAAAKKQAPSGKAGKK